MSSRPIHNIFLFLCCAIAPVQLLICQERGVEITHNSSGSLTGKTYGLIIGISKYQNFPSLQYADKDAGSFYNFLRSKAGGNIDSADIYYTTNDKAKAGDLWRGVSWLQSRADSAGESAVIYFSGHGDAANSAEAYLLAYDAPNGGDPNLYNTGGTFQIYNLKNKIKQMVSKGVKVILITDACRNRDLPGKENGNLWTFESITEEKCGEIQMISCSGNEQSLEDKKWGDGRGVFSFYLLNGLTGMADTDPVDGRITFYELERYVKDKVRADTRSATDNKPRQNPVFCCSEKNDIVLSEVSLPAKDTALMALAASGPDNNNRGLKTDNPVSDTFQHLYALFKAAVENKKLIEPKDSSASYYLSRLLPAAKDTLLKQDLQNELVSALLNEAQASINRYASAPILDTTDSANFVFFNNAALLLKEALKHITDNEALATETNVKRLLLEARALLESGMEDNSLALAKVDSSLALMVTLHGYCTKGLLLAESAQYDEALHYLEKASGPVKAWAYPIAAEGDLFRSLKKYDSAVLYYKTVLAINPLNDNGYFKTGVAYQENGQYDSSVAYLTQALAIRTKKFGEENYNSVNALNYLAKSYDEMGNNSTAERLYQRALNICKKMPGQEHPYYANTLANLADLYEKTGNYAAAEPVLKQALAISRKVSGEDNPAYAGRLSSLGLLYAKAGNYAAAEPVLQQTLAIRKRTLGDEHTAYAASLNNLAALYEKMGNHAAAKPLYEKAAIIIDKKRPQPNNNQPVVKPPVLINQNPSSKDSKVQGIKTQPDIHHNAVKRPAIEAGAMSDLLEEVITGRKDAADFAGYLCGDLSVPVKLNNNSMTFAAMCNELKKIKEASKVSKPVVRLTSDPATNCLTFMEVSVTRKSNISLNVPKFSAPVKGVIKKNN